MTDPIRLAKRVAEIAQCSRADAERYVEDGWVTVDGVVVDRPQHKVSDEQVAIDPAARLEAPLPATLLLHKPPGHDAISGAQPALALATQANHWSEDGSGVRPLRRHPVDQQTPSDHQLGQAKEHPYAVKTNVVQALPHLLH